MDNNRRRKKEEQALKFMNKRAYVKAIKEYTDLMVGMPREPKYLKPLAQCYQNGNNREKAIETYQQLAEAYKGKNLYKQAVAIYHIIIDLGEDRESIYDDMSSCYQSLNMNIDAARVYRKLLENYMVRKLFRSATALSEKILAINPNDTIAMVNFAEAELASGGQEQAITLFKQAAELYKQQNNLNMYIKILGRIDHVTEHSDPKILNELAMIYLTQHSYGPNLLEILLKSYRISKELQDYESLTETTTLLVTFFRETNQRRQMLSIMFELAKIYETTENLKKAQETYNKILQIAPGSQEVRKRAEEVQKKLQEAQKPKDLPKSASVPSGNPQSQKNSKNDIQKQKAQVKSAFREIDTYIKFKLFAKAEPIARDIYTRYPGNMGAAKRLKDIYIKSGKLVQAIEILLKMFQYAYKSSPPDAKGYLEEVIYYDPANDQAAQLLKQHYGSEVAPPVTDSFSSTPLTGGGKSSVIESEDIESITLDEDDFSGDGKSDYQEKVDQIRFYIRQAMFDDARKDLDQLLKGDSNNPELLTLLSELEQAVKPIIIEDQDQNQHGEGISEDVSNIFEKFKEGVDNALSKDDVRTRYDLAIAYKEMGLISDAINEFKLVFKHITDKIDCLVMIGLCYVDKGDYDIAIKYFKKSMDFPLDSVDQKLSIYYEIANAYELQGNLKHAFGIYKKIAQKDKQFRDVYQRLKKLLEKLKNPDKSKGDQVSYV